MFQSLSELTLSLCVWSVVSDVCMCVFWLCGHWRNNLTRLPSLPSPQSDLCTWFCPVTSASSGSCLTDFSKAVCVERSTGLTFSCLDFPFQPFGHLFEKQVVGDMVVISFCWLVEITQCLYTVRYASDSILSCWVFNYMKSWNVMDSVGMVFNNLLFVFFVCLFFWLYILQHLSIDFI